MNESTRVISEYFIHKPVMDNSLSDFEEKKHFAVAKKSEKPSTSKPKPKKNLKKIRGQKDIRTALKTKNELISYTNEFDKVCKLTGIDVDTEQLQLAIALSKSLQHQDKPEDANADTTKHNSVKSSSRERIGKIRSTLLEYGFKVPEIKIETKKRGKKVRKNYKLLLTSDTEKLQIITDKYSQVLLGHINTQSYENESSDYKSNISNKLYNLATDTSYNYIKNDTVFYIEDLLQPNSNTTGSLLRDWSNIPGRPCSPEIDKVNFKYTDTHFIEGELDIILSGTFKCVKNIIKDKIGSYVISDIEKEAINMGDSADIISVDGYVKVNEVSIEAVNLESPKKLPMSLLVRSYSPDIFDDEASSVMEQSTHNIETRSQGIPFRSETTMNNDVMDLTECVKTSQVKSNDVCSQGFVSQGTNLTKRKSNDFMEITDCVVISSQLIKDNIDLTQSPDDNKNDTSNCINTKTKTIDLTQFSEVKDDDELNTLNNAENMDLTHSSNDSLPIVFINGKDKYFDDHDIANEGYKNQTLSQIQTKIKAGLGNKKLNYLENKESSSHHDLHTKATEYASIDEDCLIKSIQSDKRKTDGVSFFYEFVHRHSDENDNGHREEIITFVESSDGTKHKNTNSNLTETSDCRNSLQASLSNKDIDTMSRDEQIVMFDESCNEIQADRSMDLSETSDYSKGLLISPNNTGLIKEDKEIIIFDESSNDTMDYDLGVELNETSDNGKSLQTSFHTDTGKKDKDAEIITFDEHSTKNYESNINLDKTSNCINTLVTSFSERSLQKDDKHIDLTQTSESSEEGIGQTSYNDKDLGKKDNISIDYDEIFDEVVNSASASKITNAIEVTDEDYNNSSQTGYDTNMKTSNTEVDCLSQESVFEISDNELDYSMQKSKHEIYNFNLGGLSVIDNIPSARSSEASELITNNISEVTNSDENDLPIVDLKSSKCIKNKSPLQNNVCKTLTPSKEFNILNKLPIDTPDGYIVNTDQVTPMLDYATLSTPERNKELDKYGVKPLKRKRAIQLLTHLYNQTHPIVEDYEDLPTQSKRYKQDSIQPRKLITSSTKSPRKLDKSPRNSPRKLLISPQKNALNFHKNVQGKSTDNAAKLTIEELDGHKENIFEITTHKPVIKDLGCNPEDWVFQKREKAKLYTCRVPLHISFHNYVSSRRGLLEAILRYEPINIDCIHKGLVAEGYRYDAKDLLRFLDKKCITVKTENNKTKKHY